jgi:transposase-like protein
VVGSYRNAGIAASAGAVPSALGANICSLTNMAYPAYIREKAQQLRREKEMTINEIAERLAISRTTIYYWVQDVAIPRTEAQTAAQLRRAHDNSDRARLIREAAYDRGLANIHHLETEPSFREFVCMYIGEGYKRNRNVVSLGNSDPAVLRLANYWLRRLACNKITYELQHHADQDPDELRRFWSSELGCDPDSISVQRKSNSNGLTGRTWRSVYGVLQVRTNDTLLRAELQAWMDAVEGDWEDLDQR